MDQEADKSSYQINDWPQTKKKILKKNVFKTDSQILGIRFDPEDTMIAAGCTDGTLKIFHLHSGNIKMDVKTSGQDNPSDSTPCTVLRWRPSQYSDTTKNVLVSAGADGKIIHWHVTTAKNLSEIQEPDNNCINTMDFNKEGTQLVTAGQDNRIRVYDEETQKLAMELTGVNWKDPGHSNRIFTVQFLPDQPHLIMSGGWDMNVYFWDQREKKAVKSFIGPKISGESIDYKNGKILTGANTAKNQLALWDFGTCEKIQDIDWEPGVKKETGAFVYGCQFSKSSEESILVGCHGLNQARIFDVNNNYSPYGYIGGFSKGIFTVDYGNFSNKFAAAGGDGLLFVGSLSGEIQ